MAYPEYLPDLGVYIQERPRAKTHKVVFSPAGQDIPFESWEAAYRWACDMAAFALAKMEESDGE